jgi:hypothetical protein
MAVTNEPTTNAIGIAGTRGKKGMRLMPVRCMVCLLGPAGELLSRTGLVTESGNCRCASKHTQGGEKGRGDEHSIPERDTVAARGERLNF